ncbi:hypothetical protein CEK28_08545 [Xenophilus sp. AP218F]|nr:hypothetical protein CEK28_08545 [Xenophilus sp. AP218F]
MALAVWLLVGLLARAALQLLHGFAWMLPPQALAILDAGLASFLAGYLVIRATRAALPTANIAVVAALLIVALIGNHVVYSAYLCLLGAAPLALLPGWISTGLGGSAGAWLQLRRLREASA